jgi:uncharacterized membrane protein
VATSSNSTHRGSVSIAVPAVLLGIGFGGFFDGIVFHQILQWHHMLSTPYPPTSVENLELNTAGDGLFHFATWVVSLAGVGVLALGDVPLRAIGRGRMLVGGMLAGWGAFNLVEGLIDHQLLNLHHVRPGPDELLYDLAFLAWGALMLVGGIVLYRAGRGRWTASA